MGAAERRGDVGQQVRPDRGNDAEPERAAKWIAQVAGGLFELALCTEHSPRPLDDDGARRGHPHALPAALEDLHTELILGEGDLRRERRLRHMALLGGAAEPAEIGDRDDVLKLPERHGRRSDREAHSQRLSIV